MPAGAPPRPRRARRARRAARRRPLGASLARARAGGAGARAGRARRARRPRLVASARRAGGRLRLGDRLLVDLRDLAGHLGPGEALGALARRARHALRGARGRAPGRAAPRPARRRRPPAPAGRPGASARRRDSRRCARPPPACDDANASVRTMPKLSPPSEGAQSRSASPSRRHFSSSVTRPATSTPSASSSSGATSSSVAPATVRRASTPAPRSASKARSSTGRPLRPSARPMNRISSRSCGRAELGRAAPRSTPFGHDPVAPAVEAARRPLGGLRYGDPGVELGVDAAGADDVGGDRVGEPARGVGVERADRRRARRLRREPADHRHVRLVHVDDVVAAVAQLAAEQPDRLGGGRQVRHRAVHRQPERAAERDQVVGHGPLFRGRAAVKHTCQAVVGVVRGEEARLVALGRQLLGQSLDMTPDSTWIRVRVGRYQRYTHSGIVAAAPARHSVVRHTIAGERPAQLREVHVSQGGSGLAPAFRGGARRRQARVRRRLPGVRRGPLPARLLAGRDARRLRPDGASDRPRRWSRSTSCTCCSTRAG